MNTIFTNTSYLYDMQRIADADLPYEKLQCKSILITGANGLIGSYITDALMWMSENRKLNIDITILCRNEQRASRRFSHHLGRQNFHMLIQDVTMPLNTSKSFDYIIHLACNAHPLAYSTNPVGVMEANILGTINLLTYAKEHNVGRFMFVSSSEVYGDNPALEDGFYEDSFGKIDITNPRSCYSESKRAAETICACYKKQYNTDFVSVRPGFIYGATITEDNSRADAQFLRNVLDHKDIVMKSSGTQLRSYCYVADTVSAVFAVLLNGQGGEAYNIANRNSEVTIRQFAETMAKEGGVSVRFEDPDDVEKQGYSVISKSILRTDKLESLGWKPMYTLQEGVRQMIAIAKADLVNR